MKKCTAIICEYNPFHNGHLYQLNKVKQNSEIVICIMSGNTVQRGGFSISDKYSRAKIAVDMGADIVVEHIFPHSMSSARDFASSGVYIANSLSADTLAFGHESNSEKLLKIAEILSDSNIQKEISDLCLLKKNLSYAKARELVLINTIGTEDALLLRKPNNILSTEYLMSMKKYNSLSSMFIERNNSFISATEIRKKITSGNCIKDDVPSECEEYLMENIWDLPILSMLRLSQGYREIYDCDFSLYCKIKSEAEKALSVNDVIANCTSATYTASKIRRGIYSIIFNTSPQMVKGNPEFTVLLGASKKGIEYLSKNKKNISIPIFTRATDAKQMGIDTKLAFLPDTLFSLFSSKKYTPFNKPYIK